MRLTRSFATLTSAGAILLLALDAQATQYYVKVGGGTTGGTTWGTAFGNPQTALANAASGDIIWVAAGTYKPAGGQSDAFVVNEEGVQIYGGFSAAGGETLRSQRDPLVNLTILSGDIDNDSILDADNVYHVVRFAPDEENELITTDTRLDGFVITMGYADDGNGEGGGLLIEGAAPVIQNCVIVKNFAVTGGGGAHIDGPRELFDPHLETDPPFRTCRFLSNSTDGNGGAASIITAQPAFLNCVFDGNAADDDGGAIFINGSHSGSQVSKAFVTNCTFAANTAGGSGRSIFNGEELTLRNSICWNSTGSGAHIVTDTGAATTATDNNIQGDSGTTNSDPLFVWPAGPDATPGTIDDNLRLKCSSPSIDQGDQANVVSDAFDVDDDAVTTAEKTPTAARKTRVLQSDVDHGAYETNNVPCPSDISGDDMVSVDDLIAVIMHWGPCPPPATPCVADMDFCGGNGAVDVDDLVAVILDWGPCPGFEGDPESLPETYQDCLELCDGLTGDAWAQCMQGCFKTLCNTGHTEYCD